MLSTIALATAVVAGWSRSSTFSLPSISEAFRPVILGLELIEHGVRGFRIHCRKNRCRMPKPRAAPVKILLLKVARMGEIYECLKTA